MRTPLEVHVRTISQKSGSTTILISRNQRALDLSPLCPVVPRFSLLPSLALNGGLCARAQCFPGVTQELLIFQGRVSLELTPWVMSGARQARGGIREPSSWEAAVGMSRPALPSQAPCCLPVWALWAPPPGPPANLDHSACPWSLELLRMWEMRDRRP